jgi:uncharacterized protein (DUF885 family)
MSIIPNIFRLANLMVCHLRCLCWEAGRGSQPFKTAKDYDNWLKRIDQFPAWMATAEQNFRTGIKIKWYCLKSLW